MATSKKTIADHNQIIVALDIADKKQALNIVDQLSPEHCRLKVGKEMFTLYGPDWVRQLQSRGFDIFLDLKFHDIPNTVAGAVKAAAELGVWMVNVHAGGGRKMLTAARDALQSYGDDRPKLIAVTVLTHMNSNDITEIGYPSDVDAQVKRLAQLTEDCGLDGIVCSPLDLAKLTEQLSTEFLFVTPGVRSEKVVGDDQTRVMTAVEAVKAGSSYLVIGRPITQSDEPMRVINSINQQLAELR